MKINDRVLGLVGLVLAIAYSAIALQFPEPFGGPEVIGPETFPIIVASIMGISSMYILLRPDPDHSWPSKNSSLEIIIAILTLILYTYCLEFLGFILATTLLIGTLCWRMGAKPILSFSIGALGGLSVHFLFGSILDLSLPLGVLDIGDL